MKDNIQNWARELHYLKKKKKEILELKNTVIKSTSQWNFF